MDIRPYEYILTIAEEGSIQAAAEKLHITQSALSQALNKEETEAGGRLFERSRGKRITVTPLGSLYLQTAENMVRIKEETYAAIVRLSHDTGKTIRIAICNQAYNVLSDRIMETLKKNFPDINLYFYKSDSKQCPELLKNGSVDIAIYAAKEIRDSILETSLLYPEHLVLTVSKEYPVYPGNDILNQLRKIPFIYPSRDTFFYSLIPDVLGEDSLKPPSVSKSSHSEEMFRLSENGYGAALVPSHITEQEHTCKILEWKPEIRYGIYIAFPKYSRDKETLYKVYCKICSSAEGPNIPTV